MAIRITSAALRGEIFEIEWLVEKRRGDGGRLRGILAHRQLHGRKTSSAIEKRFTRRPADIHIAETQKLLTKKNSPPEFPADGRALFSASGFELLPDRLGQIDEVVEFAGAAEPQSAVDDNALAIDVIGVVADQVDGEIGQLFVAAEALHRVMAFGALF